MPAFKFRRDPSLIPEKCDLRDYLVQRNKIMMELFSKELALFNENGNYNTEIPPKKKKKNNKDKNCISAGLVLPSNKKQKSSIGSNISKDTRNENLSDSEYLDEDMSVVSSTDGSMSEVIESKCVRLMK